MFEDTVLNDLGTSHQKSLSKAGPGWGCCVAVSVWLRSEVTMCGLQGTLQTNAERVLSEG